MKMGRKEAVSGVVIYLTVALLQVGWQLKENGDGFSFPFPFFFFFFFFLILRVSKLKSFKTVAKIGFKTYNTGIKT